MLNINLMINETVNNDYSSKTHLLFSNFEMFKIRIKL